jgi:hypothetical protein
MTALTQYTPEERARALYYYFGWQGGTIHQLAEATGCSDRELLHGTPAINLDGFSAVRTCNTEWRVNRLAPQHRGDVGYWAGVIRGFWVTGPLDGLNDRYATNEAR